MSKCSKIKIAYIIDSINSVSGTEKQLVKMIELLDPEIFETVLFCLRPPVAVFNFDKRRIKYFQFDIKSVLSLKSILKIIWLSNYLRKNRIDIVQTYFMDSGIFGIIAGRIAGVKKIICCRRDLGFWYTPNILRVLKVLNRWVDRFLANSMAVKELISEFEGIPYDKIGVIHNGIESEAFRKSYDVDSLKVKFGIKDSNYVVGIAANFNRPVKRGDIFIKAAAEVQKVVPNVTFMSVGGGYLIKELESLALDLDLKENIIFIGVKEDIYPILASWDLGVICSDSEGFSNSILEYMASGVPVVATDVGGNRELVKDGVTGVLVPPGDYKCMADKICDLLKDRRRRMQIGENAKLLVHREYDWEIKIREIEAYYDSLLGY